MISDQVDRLRTAAQTYRRLGNHSAESMLLDAADTIWELRDDLQRANAENAKLRELAAGIGHLLFKLDVDYCATCPRDDINHPCPVHTVKGGECLYETDMRELGIEVDG